MRASSPGFQAADVGRDDFKAAPIPDDNVLDGEPQARSCDLSSSQDGGLSMNLWDCTAGCFRWFFASDELVQILDGEVRVTDAEGRLTVLRAGNTAHFPAGTHAVWDVPEYVKKLAIHRSPASLPARVVHKLKLLGATPRSRDGYRRQLAAQGAALTATVLSQPTPL